MTAGGGAEAILKSAEWWDGELIVSTARGWYDDWKPQIARIPASQWAAARRLGAGAESYGELREAWQEFIFGKKGADGARQGGVVDRDRRRRGWGQPKFAEDLLLAISRASEAQASNRAQAFAQEAKKLGAATELRLEEGRKAKQARLFLDFLLTVIKVERESR